MKVTILQRILPEYRLSLFKKINSELEKDEITFLLLYGQESEGSTPKTIATDYAWAKKYKNRYFKIGKFTIVMQLNILKLVKNSDLIIIEQANSLIANYIIFLLKPIYGYKIAYWGHGYNHQATNHNSLFERIKLHQAKQSDWWFTYTAGTTHYLISHGINENRITTLRNTIDTQQFLNDLEKIDEVNVNRFIKQFNLTKDCTALYCGGFTKSKEIDFLLKSAVIIKRKLPNFTLLLLGDGPEIELVKSHESEYSWIFYLGSLYGKEKALVFKSSDCILAPGQVGLIAIDAIIAEKPIIVRDLTSHGPEIEYIYEYKTGLCSSIDIDDYCKAVVSLLSDHDKASTFVENCKHSKKAFSIEHMASSFCSGIKMCLNSERKNI
jgi:glycosyltransferase involved in cell wall biosynthesis